MFLQCAGVQICSQVPKAASWTVPARAINGPTTDVPYASAIKVGMLKPEMTFAQQQYRKWSELKKHLNFLSDTAAVHEVYDTPTSRKKSSFLNIPLSLSVADAADLGGALALGCNSCEDIDSNLYSLAGNYTSAILRCSCHSASQSGEYWHVPTSRCLFWFPVPE